MSDIQQLPKMTNGYCIKLVCTDFTVSNYTQKYQPQQYANAQIKKLRNNSLTPASNY